jgi:DNA polymerase-1
MPTTSENPVILVDGSSYLFRAYHALPPLTNSNGMATGAIYGVINMLRKLRVHYKPSHVAVIFDTKGKTFRDKLYPEYKANRAATPDDLAEQIEPLHAVIRAMGFPLIAVSGVEADDVIGTLAKQAEEKHWHMLVSTGDKDMAQLVNDQVTLVNTMTDKTLDIDGVIEKFGVKPSQIIDYLALMGDKVDNIPGIPNVGPKTAAKWLQTYGDLDNIINNVDKIKGKVGENLKNHLDQLPLSKQLVTIKCDVELPVTIDQLTLQPGNSDELIHWFRELEFKRWLSEQLDAEQAGMTTADESELTKTPDYTTILTEADFDRWLARLEKADLFAFDTETTSLDYTTADIVGISFAIKPHEAAYVPLAHIYPGAPTQCDRNVILTKVKPLLENPAIKKVGQHSKYDMNVLANYGIALQGIAYDTMLESYVLNSTANRHDMDTLALHYLNEKLTSFEDVAGKGAKQVTFDHVTLEKAAPYAAQDADITLRLHHTLWPELQKIPRLVDVLTTIELPLIPILSSMECHGVLIDTELLHIQSKQINERVTQLTNDAFALAGGEFNLASPKQLQTILFEKMQLPVLKKTPTGQPSTNEDVLQALALDYPLPKILLEHRHLTKLLSTYIDKIPQQISSKTGRVHTSYHQAVAATGRLSSSDPNLQNIPIRTDEGRRIRRAFIAPEGHQLVAADYSQIELRIMAHLSQDNTLLTAFENNEDIHRATAAEVFHVALDAVTSDQRRHAKAINFGLIYGMSAFGLARQLQVEKQQAQAYIDLYFNRYPGVKRYMDTTRKQAHEHGFVETLFGRRLYLPNINARNKLHQLAAERTAINAPLQGSAADIIKKAMITIDHWLKHTNLDAKMIMQVHDELVFEVKDSDIDTLITQLPDLMCSGFNLDVPLRVDIGVASNWEEAH